MCLKHPHLVDLSCSVGQTWGHIEGINFRNLHTIRHTTEVQHKLIYFAAVCNRCFVFCLFLLQISATGVSWQLFSSVMIASLQETMAVSHPLSFFPALHLSLIMNVFDNFVKNVTGRVPSRHSK